MQDRRGPSGSGDVNLTEQAEGTSPVGARLPPSAFPLDRSTRPRAVLLKLTLSLLLAAGFVWVLRRGGLPIMPPRAAFDGVEWWTLPVYILLCSVGIYLRSYRWVYLLRPLASKISARFVLGCGFVGSAIVFFAPLRTGEVARPWLIARRGDVSFLQAAGSVVAERILDGLALSLVLVAGLLGSSPISPMPDHIGKLSVPVATIPAAAYATLPVFATAVLIMGAFQRWRIATQRLLRWGIGLVSERLAVWAIVRIEKLSDGLSFLRSGQTLVFLRDTVLYWLVMLSTNWLLLKGCGIQAGPAEAAVTLGITGMGTLVPSGPGFFGTFQLASYASLALFFTERVVLGPGAAFTVLSYMTNVALTVVSFVLGLALMRRR